MASGLVVAVVLLSGAETAFAQHHHGGHSHSGHSHSGHYHGGGWGGGWGWGGRTSYYGSSIYIGTPGFYSGVVSPYYGGYGWGSGYYPAYGYGSGYYGLGFNPYSGYGWPYYYGGFAAPPVIVPAETWYGPSAVRRMMGLDPPLGTPIVKQTVINLPATTVAKPTTVNKPIAAAPQPAAVPQGGFGVLAGAGVPPRPNVPTTNAATQVRARKEIDAGDAAFQNQRYADAFSSYKDASRIAPDLAESYLRQAAASVAMKRYDDAVAQLKFGLQLSTTWVDGPFRTSALYGDDRLSQANHLDALAQAALDRPSSDLLFLTGVMLYFAEPQQRAAPILKRALGLSLGESWHIDPFLQALEKQQQAARNVAGARDL